MYGLLDLCARGIIAHSRAAQGATVRDRKRSRLRKRDEEEDGHLLAGSLENSTP